MNLGALIPDLDQQQQQKGAAGCNPSSAAAAAATMSKSGILARACEYLSELRGANARLGQRLAEAELEQERQRELLQAQVEELRLENDSLRRQLEDNGLMLPRVDGVLLAAAAGGDLAGTLRPPSSLAGSPQPPPTLPEAT